ncbi:MAG: NAD kinase, partial [Microcella pacifica]
MTADRHLLVVAHTGRAESLAAAVRAVHHIRDAGLVAVAAEDSVEELRAAAKVDDLRVLGRDVGVGELELVIVLGG